MKKSTEQIVKANCGSELGMDGDGRKCFRNGGVNIGSVRTGTMGGYV